MRTHTGLKLAVVAVIAWSGGGRMAQAELVLAQPPAASLHIDIGSAEGVGPTQVGYLEFQGTPANSPPPNTLPFPSAMGISGTVNVTVGGNTHYRDYPAISGGPFVGQSALLSDHALRISNGTIQLTLANLQDGHYDITTYHHNTLFGGTGASANIFVTDSFVANNLVASGVLTTGTTSPNAISTATFGFDVAGGTPVLIDFQATVPSGHWSINGFDLFWTPVPLAPEPGSILLFGVCFSALGAWWWRRRRAAAV